MDKNRPAFKYLHEKFPRLSVAKIKGGVLKGPQIQQLFRDPKFQKLLRSKEKQIWMRSIKCEQTSLGMTRLKTTRIWLRICWLYFRISAAICP
ncbi:hypothetical protein AVEN_74554-1 [Araneus ventricosus]|uniref:Uncharacterized protein n=1 Tax=Araneus ventricosus TaxID=182803 RepID=A0A4Y2T1E9_ARAVE|nr:hypothetical protein AVEN_264467-1 [Araneus ventricosus]GBN94044.1 hypothetical protein AVEN_74554-1 [Araneus ventricosus]